ncbi:hypothetical protein EMPS_10123 [Entomortierella parvispora]|uniref:Uncharacterized protein n=1 Tax=Entomortierella parvispora TaxID=205924 RepID=A0A9P3HJ92_9FUNG|nr:hypothetical protein EMPS_10123 [Entomortierella parvispora]
MSTLQSTLQRSPTPLSSQHLNPHSNTAFVSYASSIASSPSTRASSPAPPSSSVPTPPDSPTSPFQHQKPYGSPPPSIPASLHNSTTVSICSGAPSPDFAASTASPIQTLVSLLFLQPTTRIVLAVTFLLTLSSIWGSFPDHCSAPSHVYYTGRFAAMLASPFVIPLTPTLLAGAHQTLGTSILLGASNLISLALFEERLTAVFNGNGAKVFRTVLLTIFALVLTIRQLLGINFSRAFGWQVPALFFSDSMLECNLGLSPFLFALLVVQALFPETTSPSMAEYGSNTGSHFAIRRIYLQTILSLFNVIPKTIVWWAVSGLLGGFLVALVVSYQRRMGRWGGKVKTSTVEKLLWENTGFEDDSDEKDYHRQAVTKEHVRHSSESAQAYFHESVSVGISGGSSREKRLSVTLWKTVSYVLPLITVLVLVLIGCNQIHTYRPDVSNELLNTTIEPATPFLLTLIIMTAPRRNNVAYIKQTLSSYLASFPDEVVDPLYSRIQIVVYTHFTDFPAFDEAKEYFETIPTARKHVKWIRQEGFEKNQRKHLISAIRKVGSVEDTVYLGIMEDDFPFCEGGWQEMLNTIYLAHQTVPEHCGVFVATGGSGLIFKRSVALTATFILENDMHVEARGERATPPDISLQNCILGKHDYCSSCADTLVVSKTLLQGHLGYNSSTSGEGYHPSQFQCGWRHPFNGWPSVHTS